MPQQQHTVREETSIQMSATDQPQTVTPTISVSAAAVALGESIVVTSHGYPAGQKVWWYLHGDEKADNSFELTDHDGIISGRISFDAPGDYHFECGQQAPLTVTVT